MAIKTPPLLALRLHDVPLPIEQAGAATLLPALRQQASTLLGVASDAIVQLRITRRSLDARQRPLRYRFHVEVTLATCNAKQQARLLRQGKASPIEPIGYQRWYYPSAGSAKLAMRPVVVGAGPAGLFAALTLAEAGWAPILIERGEPVEVRSRHVSQLYSQGILQSESNVCYGEGGAGTYSDGKLYTRIGGVQVRRILAQLVASGAKADIQVHHRPHVGTDRLVVLLRNLRQHLQNLGTTILFGKKLQSIHTSSHHGQTAVAGLTLATGEHIACQTLVLATGHSAKEVWYHLAELGLPLSCRPFAVGFRIEHPQALINQARYGQANQADLPAASYALRYQAQAEQSARGVYSFCMCPGGVVVTTPTSHDRLCINGMSQSARQGRHANSALVVTVTPQDFAAAGWQGPFAGVDFQAKVEQAAMALGGGQFVAPANRIDAFMQGRISADLPHSSYRRGLVAQPLDNLYPANLMASLRQGLQAFTRQLPGIISEEGVLIGVETRTAAPIRVPRAADLQAIGLKGLYPAGEGMGYGGGIVSAAADGIDCAEAALQANGALSEQAWLPAYGQCLLPGDGGLVGTPAGIA